MDTVSLQRGAPLFVQADTSIEGLPHPRGAGSLPIMSPVECLILEAKEALLDDQHQKLLRSYQEGRWDEAALRVAASLSCTADLLRDERELLRRAEEGDPASPPRTDASRAPLDGELRRL